MILVLGHPVFRCPLYSKLFSPEFVNHDSLTKYFSLNSFTNFYNNYQTHPISMFAILKVFVENNKK